MNSAAQACYLKANGGCSEPKKQVSTIWMAAGNIVFSNNGIQVC